VHRGMESLTSWKPSCKERVRGTTKTKTRGFDEKGRGTPSYDVVQRTLKRKEKKKSRVDQKSNAIFTMAMAVGGVEAAGKRG